MVDVTWLASTTGKTDAGTLDGDEEFRVIDDPGGTPGSKKTTPAALATYVDGTLLTKTPAKSDAGVLDGDEVIRVVDDPSGTPAQKKTTPAAMATYIGKRAIAGEAAARLLAGDQGVAIDFAARSIAIRDYAGALTASGAPSEFLTFTRASDGMYVDNDGILKTAASDVMRYHHDPTTGEPLGLYCEGARTNLLRKSSNLSNVLWATVGMNAPTIGVTKSPRDINEADSITEDTSTGSHYIQQVELTGDPSIHNTASIFVKVNGRSRCWLLLYQNGSTGNRVDAYFDLTGAGSVVQTNNVGNGANVTARIKKWFNGWWRIEVTGQCNTAVSTGGIAMQCRLVQTGTTFNYTGDGSSGLFFWHGQLEDGFCASSPIITNGAAVARASDRAEVDVSLFPNTVNAITMAIKMRTYELDTIRTTVPLCMVGASGVNGDSVSFRILPSTQCGFYTYSGSVAQSGQLLGSLTRDADSTMIGSMRKNLVDARSTILGAATQDTVATVPSNFNVRLGIGGNGANNPLNGTIAKLFVKTRTTPQTEMTKILAAI